MISSRDGLAAKFREENRYANFGACIGSIEIDGIRGVSCKIAFDYPVTAITGMNGSGKTTVGQLLLCAYNKRLGSEFSQYSIGDFFRSSLADRTLFDDNASVLYEYISDVDLLNRKAVSITRKSKGWSDYRVRPRRSVIYISPASYLPKYIVKSSSFNPSEDKSDSISMERHEIENGKMWISRILGNAYDDVFFQITKDEIQLDEGTKYRNTQFCVAERLNVKYSEGNMGFGEGRVIRIVARLESCPKRSLVVLDEPDIGLHISAQRELTKYLKSVSFRRGHQIFFSTHSSEMVDELPPQGRKMLERDKSGVSVIDNISSTHMRNALSDSKDGFLIVCVEDEFAKSLLEEIVITRKRDLFRRIKVTSTGNVDAVRDAVKYLRKSKVSVLGVLDGDQSENRENKIHILPGDKLAPEKVVYHSVSVKKMLLDRYRFDFDGYLASYPNLNHHKYSNQIGRKVNAEPTNIDYECIREFVRSQPNSWGMGLVDIIDKHA